MGRAHAGLGHKREATSLMQACIEAVKTAPAYKYRADKRWLARLITRRVALKNWSEALEPRPGDIKVVIDFTP